MEAIRSWRSAVRSSIFSTKRRSPAPWRDVEPDLVVNAAAYTAVDKAESDAATAFAINRDGAGALAAAARASDVPIIHISTDYVFDGRKAGAYVETDATNPIGVYARSKLEGEAAVAAANPRHLILRTAWLYAPYGRISCAPCCGWRASGRSCASLPTSAGNPTYAPHLAEAILAIADALGDGRDEASPGASIMPPRAARRPGTALPPRSCAAGARLGMPQVPGDPHHDGRVSDAGQAPGQLPPRLQQARAHLRRASAALAAGSCRHASPSWRSRLLA